MRSRPNQRGHEQSVANEDMTMANQPYSFGLWGFFQNDGSNPDAAEIGTRGWFSLAGAGAAVKKSIQHIFHRKLHRRSKG